MNRRQFLATASFIGVGGKRSSSLLLDGIPFPKYQMGDVVLSPYLLDGVFEVWSGQVIGFTWALRYRHNDYAWHYFLKWLDGSSAGIIEQFFIEERYLALPGTSEGELLDIALLLA